MFGLYFDGTYYSCENGAMPVSMGSVAECMYMNGGGCGVIGDIKKVKYIITFEKVTAARKFWRMLDEEEKNHYILLVTGGWASYKFFLLRKFICVSLLALTGKKIECNYSTGDCDASSIYLQYMLEKNANLGPADEHLVMEMFLLGPLPGDGKSFYFLNRT